MQTESPLEAVRIASRRHQAPSIAEPASSEYDDVEGVLHGDRDDGLAEYQPYSLHVPVARKRSKVSVLEEGLRKMKRLSLVSPISY